MRTSVNGRRTKVVSGATVKAEAGARTARRRQNPGGDRASWQPTPFMTLRIPARRKALKPRAPFLAQSTKVDCRRRRQNGTRATAIDEMARLRRKENP